MIAIDSSSLIAYLSGARGKDVEMVEVVFEYRQGVLPPVVLTEILSDPKLPSTVSQLVAQLPVLDVIDGYWRRAGILRAKLSSVGRRARLADSLIAQTCIDHDVPLITRDSDFRLFAHAGGLKLFPAKS